MPDSKLAEEQAAPIVAAVRSYFEKAIAPILERLEQLEAREQPKTIKGEKGDAGDIGPQGEEGKCVVGPQGERGERGADGKDGKDGETIHPDTVLRMVMEAVEKAVAKIPPAANGRDGKDAIELDIVDEINHDKVYAKGTWARAVGGIVRARRTTTPMAEGSLSDCGWQVIVDGISHTEIGVESDGRTFKVAVCKSNGRENATTFRLPVLMWRDVWKPDGNYSHGDIVTWGGSSWHCQKRAEGPEGLDKPGTSEQWKLMAKRGADGKDGKMVEPPEFVVGRLK